MNGDQATAAAVSILSIPQGDFVPAGLVNVALGEHRLSVEQESDLLFASRYIETHRATGYLYGHQFRPEDVLEFTLENRIPIEPGAVVFAAVRSLEGEAHFGMFFVNYFPGLSELWLFGSSCDCRLSLARVVGSVLSWARPGDGEDDAHETRSSAKGLNFFGLTSPGGNRLAPREIYGEVFDPYIQTGVRYDSGILYVAGSVPEAKLPLFRFQVVVERGAGGIYDVKILESENAENWRVSDLGDHGPYVESVAAEYVEAVVNYYKFRVECDAADIKRSAMAEMGERGLVDDDIRLAWENNGIQVAK